VRAPRLPHRDPDEHHHGPAARERQQPWGVRPRVEERADEDRTEKAAQFADGEDEADGRPGEAGADPLQLRRDRADERREPAHADPGGDDARRGEGPDAPRDDREPPGLQYRGEPALHAVDHEEVHRPDDHDQPQLPVREDRPDVPAERVEAEPRLVDATALAVPAEAPTR
jgi:hypothetical protein